jgi:hypothetical protein
VDFVDSTEPFPHDHATRRELLRRGRPAPHEPT